MRLTRGKIKKELIALIPPTLFFFISLHIIILVRNLMLEGKGIATTTTMSMFIASIILGKSVLVADLLPFINRYPDKPLVYNVAWKTVVYFLISTLIHYAEMFFEVTHEKGSLYVNIQEIYQHIIWPRFWAIQILLAVLLFMYCTMRELVRVIGEKKVWLIFFGRMPRF